MGFSTRIWTFTKVGVLPYQEVGGGGIGTHIKSGGKIWGKVQPSSLSKRKNLGSSVTTRRKMLGKNPNFGVIFEIQRAKIWGICHLYFGGKIWHSNKNFGGKFWGQAPRPPNMEVPPGAFLDFCLSCLSTTSGKLFYHIVGIFMTFIFAGQSQHITINISTENNPYPLVIYFSENLPYFASELEP